MGDMSTEGGVPDLATIMQQILDILKDQEERLTAVCSAHEDLDKEIHEDFFGPIHEQYQSSVRSKGIEDLKGKHGAMLGDISDDQWKGFGIDNVYERLYDELEKLKGGEGWGPESESKWIGDIHSQAMDRIKQITGSPKIAEPEKGEKVEVKEMAGGGKNNPGGKEALAAGKRNIHKEMIGHY